MVGCGVPFTVHASFIAAPSDTSTDSKVWVNWGAVPVGFLAEERPRNAIKDKRREFMVSSVTQLLYESLDKQIPVLFDVFDSLRTQNIFLFFFFYHGEGGVAEWFRALDLKSDDPWFKSFTLTNAKKAYTILKCYQ